MSPLEIKVSAALRDETDLVRSVGQVIARCLENEPERELSQSYIARACELEGLKGGRYWTSDRPPSYGTIDRTMRLLRRSGVIAWMTAFVLRWHAGTVVPTPDQPRVIRQADGSYRLPTRFVRLVATGIERFQAPTEGAAAHAAALPPSEPTTPTLSIPPATEAGRSPGWFSKLVTNYGLGSRGPEDG